MPEWSELIVIMVVAMVVFGPHRLPAMARKAGRMMAEFRVAARELREGIEKELAVDEMREAAKEVLDSTKEASHDLRQSLSESEKSLKTSPRLAKPTDTKPGTERTGQLAASDTPHASGEDDGESQQTETPSPTLPDADSTPAPGDEPITGESDPAPPADQQ
jgi:Tat protein translocase TatB subunit